MGTDFDERAAAWTALVQTGDDRPASTARGVHHAAFICSDVGRTIAFYQDLLGFPLVELFENRDYPASAHLFFDIGNGNLLAFFDFPGYEHPEFHETLGGVQHLAISMAPENFVTLKARLVEDGIEFRGPDLGVEHSVYLRDPDGLQIEICTAPLMDTDFD
ncbi:MAG: VOC family protein [Acidimicrobiia bacterium]